MTTSSTRASGRSTLLTTRITRSRASSALRRTNRVCGSGPSLASTSSSTPSTIRRPRSTSPPKSACPGVSTMLIFVVAVADGGVLGEDRDALLALEVHRVHHALGDVLVRAERAGLPQHRVDERRLAVVDVRHDGDVADVVALGHRSRVAAAGPSASVGASGFTSLLRTHHDGLTMESDDRSHDDSLTPPPDRCRRRSWRSRCRLRSLAAAARRGDRPRRRPVGRLRARSCCARSTGASSRSRSCRDTVVRLNGARAAIADIRPGFVARVVHDAKAHALVIAGVRHAGHRPPTAAS